MELQHIAAGGKHWLQLRRLRPANVFDSTDYGRRVEYAEHCRTFILLLLPMTRTVGAASKYAAIVNKVAKPNAHDPSPAA